MAFSIALQKKTAEKALWIVTCAVLCLAAQAAIAQNASPAQPVVLTPGGPAIEVELQPSVPVSCILKLPAGNTTVLSFRETAGVSAVAWTDAGGTAHTPRTNRGGRNAIIRFTVPGSDAGPQQFAIGSQGNHPGNKVTIIASEARASAAADQAAMDAEESLAMADLLWSKHDAGNAKDALAAYDRAIAGWDRLNDTAMLRRSLAWKAVYLAFTASDPKSALPLLDRATALADSNDVAEQANAWKTLGFVQTTLANYSEGWKGYARALDLFGKTGDLFNREVMLENRGKLSQMTGDLDGALNDASAAMQIARGLSDRVGVLHIEDNIGAIYLQRGELQAAFDAYQDVLAGLKQIDSSDPMIGFAETDLAQLYEQLGAQAQAQSLIAVAKDFWKAHPYTLGQLNTIIQRGKIDSAAGNLAAAQSDYDQGVTLAESAAMKRELVFCLLGRGNIARQKKQFAAAEEDFRRASELANAIDEYDGLAQIRIAQADLKLGTRNLQEAESLYQQALAIASQSFDHAGIVAAHGGMARAEEKLGKLEQARRNIEQSLEGIESTRDFIAVDSLKTAYFSSQHSYYDLAVDVLMHLAKLHPADAFADEALEVAERARARALLDQISGSGSSVGDRADPALAAQRAATLRELRLRESSLVVLRADSRQSAQIAQIAKLQLQVAGLEEQEDKIEGAMHLQSQAAATGEERKSPGAVQSVPAQAVSALRAHLDSSTALLEYWVGDEASYLWVVTAASVRSYALPRAAVLSRAAERMNSGILAPYVAAPASAQQLAALLESSHAGFMQASQQLAQFLLPPQAIPRQTKTLLIAGDGPLLSVPFPALRVGAGSGARFLQDRYCIVQEPSIHVLLNLIERKSEPGTRKTAIVADPVYAKDDPRFAAVSQPARDPHGSIRTADDARDADNWAGIPTDARLERLAYAGHEANDIAVLAGPEASTQMLGFQAAPETVKAVSWLDYAIAHFAAHAWMNPHHPELAGVALSRFDQSGRKQQGVLWFSDIAALRMPVQLVTLSACESANGEQMPGEGLVGLSYSFFLAGAHRVVGSLWSVDDKATESLMSTFYTALLQDHASPAEALRSAQRKLAGSAAWSDPYYWAGFTIEGDWRALPESSGFPR